MSITHCIIMVMHAMLSIMAKLVRLPSSSSKEVLEMNIQGLKSVYLTLSVCVACLVLDCDIHVSHAMFGYQKYILLARSAMGGTFITQAAFLRHLKLWVHIVKFLLKTLAHTRPSGAKRW